MHGANRLASNSLLEGLVFAERIGADLARGAAARGASRRRTGGRCGLLDAGVREQVAATMTDGAGVLRSGDSLTRTLGPARRAGPAGRDAARRTEAWEATNLHTVASFVAAAAADREETRGSHWREDFPERDDAHWRGHLVGTARRCGPRRLRCVEPCRDAQRRSTRPRWQEPA